MRATVVEDLQVFQRASLLVVAVLAITGRLAVDAWLRHQLDSSAESIASNIAEGFSQLTDRAFARYLAIAAGSAEELRVHLHVARATGLIGDGQAIELAGEARQIANMLKALIRYLHRSNRTDRLTRRT